MQLKNFDALLKAWDVLPAQRIAVAAPYGQSVLAPLVEATVSGRLALSCFGDIQRMQEALGALKAPMGAIQLYDCPTDDASARAAVAAVRDGACHLLMKGDLSTATLMRAVLDQKTGLRAGHLLSHFMLCELPERQGFLALTDGGLNLFPDLKAKEAILKNAVSALQALGYKRPTVAVLCASEMVSEKQPASLDAKALEQAFRDAEDCQVLGPISLDLAVSEAACKEKAYQKPGGGQADLLLVPDVQAGNFLGKALQLFGRAKAAGVVLGGKVPIVLVSRADDAKTKRRALALAAVLSTRLKGEKR